MQEQPQQIKLLWLSAVLWTPPLQDAGALILIRYSHTRVAK